MADIIDFPGASSFPGGSASDRAEPEPLWRSVLGARLRRLRSAKGYNLTRTARRAGISPQYLSEIERGLKEPSSEVVAAVAGALDCTVLEVASLAVADLRRTGAGRASGVGRPSGVSRPARPGRPAGPVAMAA